MILDFTALGVTLLLLALVVTFIVVRRRRRPSFAIRDLPAADAARYSERLAAAIKEFDAAPAQAAALARGFVYEVLRRKGFPDRIDAEQRIKDLRARDAGGAEILVTANAELRAATDPEGFRRALEGYSSLLDRLLADRG